MSHLRIAARQLLRRPGFSLVVIVMLALGIGTTTAMFSWVHTLLLQPLPVPDPGRLVNLSAPGPKPGQTSCSFAGDCAQVFSYPMFRDLEAQQDVFKGIAGHRILRANLSFEGRTEAAPGLLVSGSYFGVLGLAPAAGRLIEPADEPRVGEAAVVVLGYEHWQNAFGGDPDIVGSTLLVNGVPLTIVGVAPRGFSGTTIGVQPRIFVPLSMRWVMEPTVSRNDEDRLAYWIYAFARLEPGITIEQASSRINALYSGIVNDVEAPLNDFLPDDLLEQFKHKRIGLEPGAQGQSEIPRNATQPLMLLFGVTGLVLLVVCVNVASLLLARGASRVGEMAIRVSIGASRRHLFTQSLTEAGLLALIGGVCGLPLAAAILAGIQAMIPVVEVGTGINIDLNGTALWFAAAVTVTTVFVFGLVPAIKATSTDPGLAVKGQASQAASGRAMTHFRGSLATAQIALSMLLLALAGLFTQSLMNVTRENLGMNVDSLVAFNISPRLNGYGPERTMAVFDELDEALVEEPGVVDIGSASVAIIADNNSRSDLTVQGLEAGPNVDTTSSRNEVSVGFFRTLEMPLLAGRGFEASDRVGAPRVAVVNQTFLRKFGLASAADAIGTRFGEGRGSDALDIEIVGVIADAKYSTVKGDIPPQFFLPRRQNDNIDTLTYYVRGVLEPDTLFATIRRVASRIDANLPVSNFITMVKVVDNNVFFDRMVAWFSAAFAAVATLLAAVGLYGVLAYNVAQRTRELGVRLALGATPAHLRGMVFSQVGRMALLGIPIGLVAAIVAGRAAAALLFGLSGSDPAVFAAAALVLMCVVAAAGYLPARRAARVAPMEALRYE